MGARRGGRDNNPLAGVLRRSSREAREEEVAGRVPEGVPEGVPEQTPERDGRTVTRDGRDAEVGEKVDRGGRGGRGSPEARAGRPAGRAAVAPKKRGRPRGGRRSNPEYVQISARIHRDVRFSLERVLVERSEREGRYVEMAEVIEQLMRFYVDNGDPYDLLDNP